MQYVDDLTKVKPEEIQHVDITTLIQAIVPIRYPREKSCAVVVIFENGHVLTYAVDGRAWSYSKQCFIFKPKKKLRLKPLHIVLAEQNMQWVEVHFESKNDCPNPVIVPAMFSYFGTIEVEKSQRAYDDDLVQIGTFIYHKNWFEEVEE